MREVRASAYRADERMRAIATACAELCKIPVEKIYSRAREPQYVFVRQLAMRVARERGFSLPQIAAHFERDHSTVMYSIRCVNAAIERRPELARIIAGVSAYLEAHAA